LTYHAVAIRRAKRGQFLVLVSIGHSPKGVSFCIDHSQESFAHPVETVVDLPRCCHPQPFRDPRHCHRRFLTQTRCQFHFHPVALGAWGQIFLRPAAAVQLLQLAVRAFLMIRPSFRSPFISRSSAMRGNSFPRAVPYFRSRRIAAQCPAPRATRGRSRRPCLSPGKKSRNSENP
jgi:hypothetical protein